MATRPSTRAIGLAFENHSLRFLANDLRMSLTRVGGTADGGVDLRGYWWLPKPRAQSSTSIVRPVAPPGLMKNGSPGRRIAPIRVLGQCKAENKKLGAKVVREMEGVLAHLASETPTIAVILSQSGFSKLAMEHAQRSASPMLLMYLEGGRVEDMEDMEEFEADSDGPPETIVSGGWWNAALAQLLAARGIEPRRELGHDGPRLGMWYGGGRLGRYGPKS